MQRSAAAKEMAPVHAAGAVAEPSGGGSARSEILQIDGLRDRGREAERPRKRNEATTIFITGPILRSGYEASPIYGKLFLILQPFGSLKMAGRKTHAVPFSDDHGLAFLTLAFLTSDSIFMPELGVRLTGSKLGQEVVQTCSPRKPATTTTTTITPMM